MIAVWSFGLGMMAASTSLQSARIWLTVHYIGAMLIPPTFLHYTFELVQATKQKKQLWFWYPLFLIFLYLNLFKQDLVVNISDNKPFFRYYTDTAPLYYAYTIAFVSCVTEAFIVQLRTLLQKDIGQVRRLQLVYMFAATSFGFVGGTTAFFPVFGWSVFPWGMYLVILYPLVMTYAIIRHRLLDIRLAITRTGIFVFVYCVVLGIPAVMVWQGKGFLEDLLGPGWWLLPGGLYAVLSFVGPFIYMMLQRKAEAVLLKEQKAYQQTLLQASRGMTLIKDLDRLLKLIVHILTKTIRITHARIFLRDPNDHRYVCRAVRGDHSRGLDEAIPENTALIRRLYETQGPLVPEEARSQDPAAANDGVLSEMETLGASLIVPSFVQDRLLGFVALGEKRSKGPYTEGDLDTLATLANQAALAIENCIFLTEFEQQQAHFFQTAKMADLGTMASGIGHQVNNRFNLTKLGAEVMMMSTMPRLRKSVRERDEKGIEESLAAMEKSLASINKNAAHGGEIVSRLLDFTRMTEGFGPVDVKEAAESCIRLWECKHDLTLFDFKMDIAPGLPNLHGNLGEIEEVLFNLLDNASDALKMKEEAWATGKLEKPAEVPKGSVSLSARETTLKDRRYVELAIADNGIGMSEDVKKQVFVPFFTTKATAIKGTGLGLYIIRRMVDAHQGKIFLETEYGKGSVFRVLFPVSDGKSGAGHPKDGTLRTVR